jgi:hypothetical protein
MADTPTPSDGATGTSQDAPSVYGLPQVVPQADFPPNGAEGLAPGWPIGDSGETYELQSDGAYHLVKITGWDTGEVTATTVKNAIWKGLFAAPVDILPKGNPFVAGVTDFLLELAFVTAIGFLAWTKIKKEL